MQWTMDCNSTYHNTEAQSRVYYCCVAHGWIAYVRQYAIGRYETKEEAELAFIEMVLGVQHRKK